MKSGNLKISLAAALSAIMLGALGAGAYTLSGAALADAAGNYGESYRNQLAYSAKEGWNNDPNGLLYVNGVYHAYYQYNYNDGATENVWGNMSWGHAISEDLVHWTEQPVAIPAYQTADGKFYGMMFSGSAVYDENNTSGLFEAEDGKVKEGQGIVAILTQPSDENGGQRQILAYSKDEGQSFEIYGEILGANAEGSLGDGEFRDPKVFWNENLGKWLMAVGGGSVRMYSSDNLTEWSYIGATDYWGECPDISRFTVDGKEKYVLIISPEDKAKSHEFNGTNRAETYYPAEYYVVGDLDEKGLFVSKEQVKRLSEGIDSYAFQSFNNSPDGKVYGLSWSASWKSVGDYEKFRENYNGGLTVACELQLIEEDGEYVLLRKPVSAFEALRVQEIKSFSGTLEAGKNALAGVRADMADIEVTLDFNGSTATYAELDLRVSAAEKIILKYDLQSETLTLDRSQSSLLARETPLYSVPYAKELALNGGKLTLRVLLDRAFISVFADGGRATYFSAVFPSAISNSMRLFSDGEMGVDAHIYAVQSIFGQVETADNLVISADKIDTTVGETKSVIASSFASSFSVNEVNYSVTEGGESVSLEVVGGTAFIKAVKAGEATLSASYKGQSRTVKIFVYENGFESQVEYGMRLGGNYSYISNDGLVFETGVSDAFLFGNSSGENIIYSAEFTPQNGAQAGGLVFGISDNLTNYWVATADFKDNKVKLWKSGVGDLKAVDYNFGGASGAKLTVAVYDGTAKIYVGDGSLAVITHRLEGYGGGAVGLNIYNAKMLINRATLSGGNDAFELHGREVLKVVNVTDGSYRLKEGDYFVEDGRLCIDESYLSTLESNTEYTFRVVTSLDDFDIKLKTGAASSTITLFKQTYERGEQLSFTVNGGSQVYRLEINGRECAFTKEGDTVTVAADEIKELTGGVHEIKAYTDKGRPAAEFTVAGLPDYSEPEAVSVSHAFFWVDIAVFAALICAYAVFAAVKKLKTK